MTDNPVLVTVAELEQFVEKGARGMVLLDVRWELGATDGLARYREDHIPGAVFVDLESELSERGSAREGRHPLPRVDDLQEDARRWGLDDSSFVVAYDSGGGIAAARAWWVLRWAGVADVRVLDGGLRAWKAAGNRLVAGPGNVARRGHVTLSPGHLPTVDIDEAAGFPTRGTLLDARAVERYRGTEEPVDPRAGHIPGAVSAPSSDNLAPDGTFLSADVLRERYAALAPTDEVAVYCGSGVSAAHDIVALTLAGREAALYPGSWSQWSHDLRRAVATGDHP